jgi:hypothetical protein
VRIILDLTPGEYRAAHDLVGYALRRALEDDPDTDDLRSFFHKFAESRGKALCKECKSRRVYARGRCQACWRSERRAS